jgi:hypothetical protein
MIGACKMELKNITIDVMRGEEIRKLASTLMKAENGGKYLIFVQKVDSDLSVSAGYCVVNLRVREVFP